MAIAIFYVLCGLSILFFAVFFIQCCLLASRKDGHATAKLSIADSFASTDTTRLFAHLEREMTEFMARPGRSSAPLFLIAASSAALFSPALPSVRPHAIVSHGNQRASSSVERSATPHPSPPAHISCKKN